MRLNFKITLYLPVDMDARGQENEGAERGEKGAEVPFS